MSRKNPFLGLGLSTWSQSFSISEISSPPESPSPPSSSVDERYRIIVGDIGSNNNIGAIYSYKLDGTDEIIITPSDGYSQYISYMNMYLNGDYFGKAVAVGDSKIFVSSMFDDDNGTNSGSVYTYDLDGTGETKIKPSDGSTGQGFGYSMDMRDGKFYVGASAYSNSSLKGSVYIFNSDGTGQTKIQSSDGTVTDNFGSSVSVGPTKFAVGASSANTIRGTKSGAVYVYNLDGTGETKIIPTGISTNHYIGDVGRIAINASKVLIGDNKDDTNGSYSGAAFVYDLDGTNEFKITPSDGETYGSFGRSVGIGTNKLAVGAINAGSPDVGAVYLYDLDGTNELKITPSDSVPGSKFGTHIDILEDKIVIGAEGANGGAVYVYNLDGTGEVKITASTNTTFYGRSVTVGIATA